MKQRQKGEKAILVAALFGLLLAGYALSLHYSNGSSKICNIGETFNCDKVNKSVWSEIFGIPVSLLGMIAYAALFLIVLKKQKLTEALSFTVYDMALYLFLLTLVMVLFQGYLTSLEILVIHAYCIVCLCSQICTLVATFFAWRMFVASRNSNRT